MSARHCLVLMAATVLAACGDRQNAPADARNVAAAATPTASASMAPLSGPTPGPSTLPAIAGGAPLSCAAQIGEPAAARRAAVCRDVSPATRPPCNVANSCAMIEDEIARSCALFDGDGDPMPGCGVDPNSAQAAADVIRRYYSALNARDFATAWAQWGDDGQPGRSFADFQAGFADTRASRVTIGAMRPGDAGAGSSYQPVPVTIDATLADGRTQRFTGTYVLRHVNDIDGATPGQRRWHIDSATLR